jgi:uncharacterized protein (DUF433 family)
MPEEPIDWSKCDDVESVPGRVSGAWVIKGTRVQADAIVENARAGSTAEEIAGPDIFPSIPSTSSSACCASPRSPLPRTDEDPARRKRSERFKPHTRQPRRTHCSRNGPGPVLERPAARRSRKSRVRSAHYQRSRPCVSAQPDRPKYRRHHFLYQCPARHPRTAADRAAHGRETGHFHLRHLSPAAPIAASACPDVLIAAPAIRRFFAAAISHHMLRRRRMQCQSRGFKRISRKREITKPRKQETKFRQLPEPQHGLLHALHGSLGRGVGRRRSAMLGAPRPVERGTRRGPEFAGGV